MTRPLLKKIPQTPKPKVLLKDQSSEGSALTSTGSEVPTNDFKFDLLLGSTELHSEGNRLIVLGDLPPAMHHFGIDPEGMQNEA